MIQRKTTRSLSLKVSNKPESCGEPASNFSGDFSGDLLTIGLARTSTPEILIRIPPFSIYVQFPGCMVGVNLNINISTRDTLKKKQNILARKALKSGSSGLYKVESSDVCWEALTHKNQINQIKKCPAHNDDKEQNRSSTSTT